jgi:chromosome segregation ATPase
MITKLKEITSELGRIGEEIRSKARLHQELVARASALSTEIEERRRRQQKLNAEARRLQQAIRQFKPFGFRY